MKGKKIKEIDPLSGVLETSKMMVASASGNRFWRKDVFNDDIGTHTVDTVKPTDTGTWETGVEPRGKSWIIVEQYEDKTKAEIGHKKWVKTLKDNPKTALEDIHIWGSI